MLRRSNGSKGRTPDLRKIEATGNSSARTAIERMGLEWRLNGELLPLDDSRQRTGAKNSSGRLSKFATHTFDPSLPFATGRFGEV
jgi:hypothetical protein